MCGPLLPGDIRTPGTAIGCVVLDCSENVLRERLVARGDATRDEIEGEIETAARLRSLGYPSCERTRARLRSSRGRSPGIFARKLRP